jgi:hypothetical protein
MTSTMETGRSRPVYDPTARTKRKCPACKATAFRTVKESFEPHRIEFVLLVCDNANCGAVIAGGPSPE